MEKNNDKIVCRDKCPSCGADGLNINWEGLDSEVNPFYKASCQICGCNFVEEYEYSQTLILEKGERISCSSSIFKYFCDYMDEIPSILMERTHGEEEEKDLLNMFASLLKSCMELYYEYKEGELVAFGRLVENIKKEVKTCLPELRKLERKAEK